MSDLNEMNRTVGQLEAGLASMSSKLDHIVQTVDKIETRLKAIEDRESERKGAFRLAVLVAGAIGAFLAQIMSHFTQWPKI